MIRTLAAISAVALCVGGCGGKDEAAPPKGDKAQTTQKAARVKTADKAKPAPETPKKPEPKKVTVPKVADLPVYDLDGLKKAVSDSGKDLTLVAVWATWCAPCIEEMPTLATFYEEHAGEGVSVIGLCVDDRAELGQKIQSVLDKVRVAFPMALLKPGQDEAFFKGLGVEWDGGLPATAVFDGAGELKLFTREQLTHALIDSKVAPLLKK